MTETEKKSFLNPITLEANLFLKTIEKYGSQYQIMDEELLTTMDKLVDAINKFYDQSLTKLEETDDLKLVRVKDTDYVLRSYQCIRCHKFLGPSAEKAARHISAVHLNIPPPNRKKRSTENSESANGLKLPKKARLLLIGKFGKLSKKALQVSETLKEVPQYAVIESDLMNCLQSLYPDKTFKTYKFGSRISGVGNTDSDLDIFVDIDGSFHNFSDRPTTQILDVIKKVSAALKKDKKWTQVIAIQNARVPIIRLKHASTKIYCDIGFSNSLGYCNTMLMQYFFELQPIAARMSIFLKLWLERTKLNENVSTYSFTLMVIYYLQMCFALPSIEDLQRGLEKEELIGPWISNFHKKTLKELNLEPIEVTKSALREHIYNFFIFYGEFHFENWMICPYKGEMVRITDITKELPTRYADFVKSSEGHVELQLNRPIVVQDPLELSHNVTKGVSKSLLKVFISYFMESAKIMSSEEPEKSAPSNEPAADNNATEQSNTE